MANMRRTKQQMKRSRSDAAISSKPDPYPWGLQLSLEKDSLKKLKISAKDQEIGAKVGISGKGEITHISTSAGQEGESESISIQITDLELSKPAASAKSAKSAKNNIRSLHNPCKHVD